MEDLRMRRGHSSMLVFGILCLLFSFGFSSQAHGEDPYEYSALASLTGGCGTSKVDPIPDPGCPEGAHPPKAFSKPTAVAIDAFGNEYVASYGTGSPEGAQGRIDVFDPEGNFITELSDPFGPKSVAVDSKGTLYVYETFETGTQVARYAPTKYEPATGEIAYSSTRTVVVPNSLGFNGGVVVDPSTDHLFVVGGNISEYSSVEEGNKLLETITDERLNSSTWAAIDAERRRLYASSCPGGDITKCWIVVLDADAPHEVIEEVTGADTPAGKFVSNKGWISVAVDEETGSFFVGDLELSHRVYEFNVDYEYLSTLEFDFSEGEPLQIAVSNAEGAANYRYLYVPALLNHAFAFEPPNVAVPEVESVAPANIGATEAELRAQIEPNGADTSYVFEYTTQQSYEEKGFEGALVAGEGLIAGSEQEAQVFAPVAGLLPGAEYRFRVVAENEKGAAEGEGSFTTYSDAPISDECSNQALRTVFSAGLPDCRAYELVTLPDPNGRFPRGVAFVGDRFPTFEVSPQGAAVSFVTEGGSLPGTEGAGPLNGDLYRSTRGAGGWSTVSAGPSGAESTSPSQGSTSAEQGYAFWTATQEGSAVIEGEGTHYVHYPDGHSELVGRGSLGSDPRAVGKLITEDPTHIVFQTEGINGKQPIQLEPEASPTGTTAVYDRTIDPVTGAEETHVVSLLPEDETPGSGASYVGASADGEGIAFSIGNKLYLRVGNAITYEIGEDVDFAGISTGGERIFYVEGGDLFAFDATSEEVVAFTEVGNAVVVNVAPDGTRAYFVSTTAIAESGDSPNGTTAKAGQQNLYLSEEGQISFVATLTERDVEGELRPDGQADGLGLWIQALITREIAHDPSRLNPEGSVLLFQSRANLDGYDPEGAPQVYRYDSVANRLHCISCIPTKEATTAGASLQSVAPTQDSAEPFSAFGLVPNLRADGHRAFFESTEALVSGDTDEVQDVYEWEEEGVGSCARAGGCVYLISSGQSAADNYLYGISESGDDVFFTTSDILIAGDDETLSIYDARVGGGFAQGGGSEVCEGEGCRPLLTPAPPLPRGESGARSDSGNVTPGKRCPKGKRKVKRHGKVVCVKKKKTNKHHRKAGANRRAAR